MTCPLAAREAQLGAKRMRRHEAPPDRAQLSAGRLLERWLRDTDQINFDYTIAGGGGQESGYLGAGLGRLPG
jgi:hypothetical protein